MTVVKDVEFENNDERLLEKAAAVQEERKRLGLDGLIGGLETVVINVEKADHEAAVNEFLGRTGYEAAASFRKDDCASIVLKQEGSADFLFLSGAHTDNPFLSFNKGPKSEHKPEARVEAFAYKCPDVKAVVDIQKGRGVQFMDEVKETESYVFAQTMPSKYTGNSIGYIQWKEEEGRYDYAGVEAWNAQIAKPNKPFLKHIGDLDHSATRIRAQERDDAITEYMGLTNYDFAFSVYVDSFNSITNVTRVGSDDYAQVFTSGIKPFVSLEESGPTEAFIVNYGLRLHHCAFITDNIEQVYKDLVDDGQEFLVELVGGPEEGLHQTFTVPSPYTFMVNEYILRYGDFDGFFTKSNVTLLTEATKKQ
jgi:4-hydroxyphenylpyruvate dioxygenase-like putative hemolysin